VIVIVTVAAVRKELNANANAILETPIIKQALLLPQSCRSSVQLKRLDSQNSSLYFMMLFFFAVVVVARM
jgi:hypothetical protein